ncbi:DUF4367 domain-containing protein [Niallia sp. FSL W8-0177]|uniref:DUF4367 domain-containing protein n=1 Tax=Niallia sp. FSL W8-0177 TaxID=2954522 RepID=UPI0030F905E3
MEKLYKEQLDEELRDLEADIYWDKERKNALHLKLKEQMKNNRKTKNALQPFPFVAIIGAAVILFLFTHMEMESLPFEKGGANNAAFDMEADQDERVVFTVEEQNKIENKTTVYLSEEATLPYNLNTNNLSSIVVVGEPKLSVRKEKSSILVNVDYPLKNGQNFSIRTEKKPNNMRGNGINSVVKKEYEITINNQEAVLVDMEKKPKLILKTDRYQYTISGVKDVRDLIKIAEMIEFY